MNTPRTRSAACVLLLTLCVTFGMTAHAKGTSSAPRREKSLNFENGYVEALTPQPLDSFNQISEGDRNHRVPHLYKKRTDFRAETQETLKQMRSN